ncbi:MAG: Nif3-like dinuclear metal center hexameric protein [Litorilinea sp.]
MKRQDLVDYLDEYLCIEEIRDYGPQGLQIEGRREVNRIVGMVDGQMPCVAAALESNADLLLVHHGIFWGPAQPLRGALGRMVHTCMTEQLNLYAAHLALDAHPTVGNNAELARRLGLDVVDWWHNINGTNLAALAVEPDGVKFDYLVDRFEQAVGPVQLVQAHGPRIVHRVGIMSGSGAKAIPEAAQLGCDAFLTGEMEHSQYYNALNSGLNVIYGGHYTTETTGVQALGQHLQERFDLDFEFIDLPTGV